MSEALEKANKTRLNKLQKRLRREMGRAIEDFNMIEDGDKVMVCLSGGKDSFAMLDILMNLQKVRRFSLKFWRLTLIRNSLVSLNMYCLNTCLRWAYHFILSSVTPIP